MTAQQREQSDVVPIDLTNKLLINEIRTTLTRSLDELFGITPNGLRNYNKLFGYHQKPDFKYFYSLAKNSGVANRLTIGMAKLCWRQGAEIEVPEDESEGEESAKKKTILSEEIKILARQGLFKRLESADALNRIGRYSVLFVGVPDGEADPKEPLGTSSKEELKSVYFQPFAEDNVKVTKYNTDITSPRFNLPELYQLTLKNRDGQENQNNRTIPVHWSRIVHLAEGALESVTNGTPYLEPIKNRIEDLNKTIGSAAEAFFRNARGKYSFEAEPGFGKGMDDNAKKEFQQKAEDFTNNLEDFIRTVGFKTNSLSTTQHDPDTTAKVCWQEISSYSGYPMRALTGEGAGQLAGTEDRITVNNLVMGRQEQDCSNWLLEVLQILDNAGMLVLPEDAEVDWPELAAATEKEKAEIAKIKAEALEKIALAFISLAGGFDVADVVRVWLDIEVTGDMSEEDIKQAILDQKEKETNKPKDHEPDEE